MGETQRKDKGRRKESGKDREKEWARKSGGLNEKMA